MTLLGGDCVLVRAERTSEYTIASTWIEPRSLEIIDRIFSGAEARVFAGILAGGAEMGPLAVYAYNRQAVRQEIVHPGGEVECREPLQADFLTSDTTRMLYQAVA